MSVTIQVHETTTADLATLASRLDGAAVMRVIGRAASNTTKAHFRKLDKERANQMGGKRTHFWRDAANSTSFQADLDTVKVVVDHIGVAQRYFGGTLLPVASKYLTIPATPEAYGKRAGEFDDLEYRPYKGPKARGALTLGEVVYFWLVESIEQHPDPSVIPDDATYTTSFTNALLNLIAAQGNRGVPA